jgi:hypothetical protein
MGAIALAKVTLASQVANGGTFTVTYPAGVTQAMLLASTGGVMMVNADARFNQGATPGFTVAFGASNATVTQNTGAALPAGTVIDISFGDTQQAGRFETGARVRGVTALTAATGTASDTIADVTGSFVQATLNNNFKSLADKVNEMRAALVSAGILNG